MVQLEELKTTRRQNTKKTQNIDYIKYKIQLEKSIKSHNIKKIQKSKIQNF